MTEATALSSSYRRAGQTALRQVCGETLLIPISRSLADLRRIYTLNPVGQFIWGMLDETRTGRELAAAVMEEFAVPDATRATGDILVFIEQLRAAGLLEVVSDGT